MNTEHQTPLLKTEQAAQYLSVSKAFLERDRWAGAKVPFIKIGSRTIRYRLTISPHKVGNRPQIVAKTLHSTNSAEPKMKSRTRMRLARSGGGIRFAIRIGTEANPPTELRLRITVRPILYE